MVTLHARARQRARHPDPALAAGALMTGRRWRGRLGAGLLPVLVAALVMTGLGGGISALVTGAASPGPGAVAAQPLLGGALLAAGLAWAAWAAWLLARAGTPFAPGGAPRVLVDEGPFRHGRHPMVLGLGVALAGTALATGSLAVAALGAAWVLAQQAWWLPAEEGALHAAFGGWYRDYAEHTPRWF